LTFVPNSKINVPKDISNSLQENVEDYIKGQLEADEEYNNL